MKVLSKIAHLFYPSESNNQTARLLHKKTLFAIVLTVFAFPLFLREAGFTKQILGYAANISPAEVIRLTNEKRVAAGVGQLSENSLLSQAALAKGTHMLDNNYWAHVAPDGTEPWYFFTNFGYSYRYAGENLARDFTNPTEAVEAWMNSPSHRENLLAGKYEEIGVAVVEGDLNGADTTIIVQFFGTSSVDTTPAIPVAKAEAPKPTVVPESLALEDKSEVVAVAEPHDLPEKDEVNVDTVVQETDTVSASSPFSVTRVVYIVILSVLVMVVAVDGYVIYKKKIPRNAGRRLAHFSFFAMILAMLLIAKAGSII